MPESYAPEVQYEVIELCLDFILFFLGEHQYDTDSSHMSDSKGPNRQIHSEIKQICLLIFDNATIMEPESYSLLMRVYQ